MKFGGGKTVREGMGQATNRSSAEAIDLLISNCLIIDWTGIYKVITPPLINEYIQIDRFSIRQISVSRTDVSPV